MTNPEFIIAESSESDDEKAKTEFAWDVMKGSNEAILSFARLMAPVSLTAAGAVLTLTKLTSSPIPAAQRVWLAVACGAYLGGSIAFASAVRGRRMLVSPNDYDDILEQFLAAAHRRHRTTLLGMTLITLATIVSIVVVIFAIPANAPGS